MGLSLKVWHTTYIPCGHTGELFTTTFKTMMLHANADAANGPSMGIKTCHCEGTSAPLPDNGTDTNGCRGTDNAQTEVSACSKSAIVLEDATNMHVQSAKGKRRRAYAC